MSLGVVIKGPEGIVIASDSRVTIEATRGDIPYPYIINFDNASKILSFTSPHNYVGLVTYGAALIGKRTAYSFISEIEESILSKKRQRLEIIDYANLLSEFFLERWNKDMPRNYKDLGMTFIVGGYGPKDAYGNVYIFNIPNKPTPQPRNRDSFGMTWGGQLEIASRIVHGYDPKLLPILKQTLNLNQNQLRDLQEELKKNLGFPIPYDVLPLQDCIDLAILLLRSTINAQRLAVGVRGVGGLIEIAVITRTRQLTFIQKKELKGENINWS